MSTNQNVEFSLSTGKFGIAVSGSIKPDSIAELAQEGLISKALHRGAFAKTEVLMAKKMGKVRTLKNGEVRAEKGFKRNECAFDRELAQKFVGPLAEALNKFGVFAVTVSEHVPGGTSSKVKEYEAKVAGLAMAKEFMTEEQYAAKVDALKAEYGIGMIVEEEESEE